MAKPFSNVLLFINQIGVVYKFLCQAFLQVNALRLWLKTLQVIIYNWLPAIVTIAIIIDKPNLAANNCQIIDLSGLFFIQNRLFAYYCYRENMKYLRGAKEKKMSMNDLSMEIQIERRLKYRAL